MEFQVEICIKKCSNMHGNLFLSFYIRFDRFEKKFPVYCCRADLSPTDPDPISAFVDTFITFFSGFLSAYASFLSLFFLSSPSLSPNMCWLGVVALPRLSRKIIYHLTSYL